MDNAKHDNTIQLQRNQVTDVYRSNWLYAGEEKLLESFLERLDAGYPLTERQLAVLVRITNRIDRRQHPIIFPG